MHRLSTRAFLIVIMMFAVPVAIADEYRRKSLVKDEIRRHVIDECDLYIRYEKNKFGFPPLEVDSILNKIHKQRHREQAELVGQIYSEVGNQPSFFRRSRIYDIYYGVCIGRISVNDAKGWILDLMEQTVEEYIESLDHSIYAKYTSEINSDRAVRDKNRVRVLNLINLLEMQEYMVEKNRSVIQEYKYDIELWKW